MTWLGTGLVSDWIIVLVAMNPHVLLSLLLFRDLSVNISPCDCIYAMTGAAMLTGQFADKPTRGLVNSLTSQHAESEFIKITEKLPYSFMINLKT